MSKKYTRGKCLIRNSLYKRFTNLNRGNTPRGFATKYLVISLDRRKRRVYGTLPFSIRSGRIYNVRGKYNGYFNGKDKHSEDQRFDFCRFNVSDSIIELANTLPCETVSAMYIDTSEGIYKLVYMFPFTMGKGTLGKVKLEKEESIGMFYPGVYYSKGSWYYTNTMSSSLLRLSPYYGSSFSFYNNTTDYSSCIEEEVDFTVLSQRKYFIYIPFDIIRTPVLQAYLPINTGITLRDDVFSLSDQATLWDIDYGDIFWMGRKFDIQEITNRSYSVTEYTGYYNLTSSQPNMSVADVAQLCGDYFQHNVPYDTIYPSSDSGYGRYTGVFVGAQKTWDPSLNINNTPQGTPRVYREVYPKACSAISLENKCSLSSFTRFYSLKKNLPNACIYYNICYTANNKVAVNSYGIDLSYTPETTQRTLNKDTIIPNKDINMYLRDILYCNSVPCNSGFSHLNTHSA